MNLTRQVADRRPAEAKDKRRVFVVYGRNLKAHDAMFAFLRSIDIDPIEWGNALAMTGAATPYVGDALDQAFSEAQAVVVLITGDDLARLGTRYVEAHDPPEETDLTPQARPNVLFEAGMAFGRYPKELSWSRSARPVLLAIPSGVTFYIFQTLSKAVRV